MSRTDGNFKFSHGARPQIFSVRQHFDRWKVFSPYGAKGGLVVNTGGQVVKLLESYLLQKEK